MTEQYHPRNLKEEAITQISEFQNSEDPFKFTDDQLEVMVRAIKSGRGDIDIQRRSKVRNHLAKIKDWKFAMDGGFMPKKGQAGYPSKFWQNSVHPFSSVYIRYENLVLHMIDNGFSLDEVEDIAASSIKRTEEGKE